MESRNSNNTNEYEEGVFTLESILAEYKSNALISGEKKTPKEKLDKQTEELLNGMKSYTDGTQSDLFQDDVTAADAENILESSSAEAENEDMEMLEKEFFGVGEFKRERVTDGLAEDAESGEIAAAPEYESDKNDDNTVNEDSEAEYSSLVRERNKKDKHDKTKTRRSRFMAAHTAQRPDKRKKASAVHNSEELESENANANEPELEPAEASRIYGATLNSMFTRGLAASIIGAIMLYLTVAFKFGFSVPAFMKQNSGAYAAVLLILHLVVMLLCVDVLIAGLKDILKLKPGAESLILVSCVVSIIDSAAVIIKGSASYGVPFSGVSALSLVFAIWGIRYRRSGMRTSLSTASVSAAPYVVTAKENLIDNGTVIVKRIGGTSGFTSLTETPDLGEKVYQLASPLMIIASLVLAVLATIVRGRAETFLHSWSAMSAVCAQFSIMFVFGLPFSITAKKLMRSGAAIAGWAGANTISKAFGVIVKDEDVFPKGTLTLNGIRMFGSASMQDTVSYTGSIIIASGSGLSGVFRDLLRQQGCPLLNVEGISCYEAGGIGATIGTDSVLVGTAGFMNLMGIRLPQELNVKNAVFTSINGELAAVFAVNYTPISSVQNALVLLLHTKISTIFAVRDFNISPIMLTQKFKISDDRLEFMPVGERFKLSGRIEQSGEPLAVLCREGLGPMAESVTGGKRLVKVVKYCTALSVVGSVLGLLIMFYLCWSNAFSAASAVNTVLYMLMWLIPVILIGNSSGMY